MLPVQVPAPVVPQPLLHLLGRPPNPLRGLGVRPLVLPELAQVPGLGVDDAAGVVVGERLLLILLEGAGLGGRVAVAQRPRVGGDGADRSERRGLWA